MTKTLTLELTERRRRLLQNALDHWTPAVKRIRSRVTGMGYGDAAQLIEPDTDLLEGTDTDPGLIARLDPQGELFDQDDTDGAAIVLNGRECRLAYYALRKHRERVQKLRTDLKEEGYSPQELEEDLEVLGRTADPDEGEPSTGLIGEVDFGWEEDAPDPDQLELDARSAPAEEPEDDDAAPGEPAGDDRPPQQRARDAQEEITDYVRDRLEEDPDVENRTLYEECQEEFPEAEIGDLTLRQFHARYPLQVKRALAQERNES